MSVNVLNYVQKKLFNEPVQGLISNFAPNRHYFNIILRNRIRILKCAQFNSLPVVATVGVLESGGLCRSGNTSPVSGMLSSANSESGSPRGTTLHLHSAGATGAASHAKNESSVVVNLPPSRVCRVTSYVMHPEMTLVFENTYKQLSMAEILFTFKFPFSKFTLNSDKLKMQNH